MIRGLAALVIAAACSQPVAPTTAPAPLVRSPAEAVILQAADVPAAYAMDRNEPMAPEDLANGLGVTQAELKQRVASGYIRSFGTAADPFTCCVIDSILIATADANAAQITFTDFRARALALGSVETDLGERFGDLSTAFVFQEQTERGLLVTITVLFRFANVVDAVEVTGRAGAFERTFVLEFARKQLERLRADVERR